MKGTRIQGKVASGLGRAQVFMSQPHYQEQFRDVWVQLHGLEL